MWQRYFNVASLDEALAYLQQYQSSARVVAGGTDLVLEMERKQRPEVDTLIDITRILELNKIELIDNVVHLGPLVTHNQAVGDVLLREHGWPLAQACWEVGAPQIRNRGTIAGNVITASPANDTISALVALGASVTLRSVEAARTLPLREFITGVRKTVMQPNEMLVGISFPALDKSIHRGLFYKLGLRRAQAISVVHLAMVLAFDGDTVQSAQIALGAVAPTIIRTPAAEDALIGNALTAEVIEQAAQAAMEATKPIDDLRGSAAYRKEMVRVGVQRGLEALATHESLSVLPDAPVVLGVFDAKPISSESDTDAPIETTINGETVVFEHGQDKTLLRLLREDGLLTGTKEGCAEGECGACTVYLDGQAVMACLVPAPRAHGAEIVTIEGIGTESELHPVQQAFIEHAAVQCGYCTPGFVMSAVKLLDEKPAADREEIQTALTGNLCRCTGYYKIVEAVESLTKEREVSL